MCLLPPCSQLTYCLMKRCLLPPCSQLTYWVPAYVKEKRFHNWLESA